MPGRGHDTRHTASGRRCLRREGYRVPAASPIFGPRANTKSRAFFLTRGWRAITLESAKADQMLQAPSNPRREGGEYTSDYDYNPREDPRGYPRGRGPGHRRHRASPREGGQDPQPAGRAGDHAPQGPVQAAGPGYGRRVARHDVGSRE